MRRLRVSRLAQQDLVEIGSFTLEAFGERQADAYLRQLDRRMRQLVRRPESGRPCDAIRSGYWRASEGRHVIFYVFSKQSLDVIRVLHERMLPERHL